MTFRETIAAIATPPGIGGIGVIRVTGNLAERIAGRLFRPAGAVTALESHRLYHGEIVDPETGDLLDDVLIAFLKSPHSYTGEDTLEISCHGGPLILRTVLEAVLAAGARPAERGEFTKRAFLNDRLDLAQAEAVCDLITARTKQGLAAAMDRLKGKLSGRIETIRDEMVGVLAAIEASIDFSAEEGILESTPLDPSPLTHAIEALSSLAATYRRGRILREGISVVIAGRPNVGKSSLLNRLLGERRAIVTPHPGTTRDFIEETLEIAGVPVRLTDTAGIRPPEDEIEKEGIDLVWERLERADGILLIFDGSMPLSPEDRELFANLGEAPLIPVLNKSDLPRRLDETLLEELLPPGSPAPVRISAKTGDGIDLLKEAIDKRLLKSPAGESSDVMIARLRHRIVLERTVESLERARQGLRDKIAPELTALEIREALDTLGEITGRTTPEEVLGKIFANFCLGK